nr:hypothetical protein L203_05670 [Cryptococcus depauperatus CBS 7841]
MSEQNGEFWFALSVCGGRYTRFTPHDLAKALSESASESFSWWLTSWAIYYTLNTLRLDIIVQFKKGSSVEDKQKAIQELKSKGAEVVKDDNINSPLMPFVVVTFSGDFSALESHFGSGSHEIVQNIAMSQGSGGSHTSDGGSVNSPSMGIWGAVGSLRDHLSSVRSAFNTNICRAKEVFDDQESYDDTSQRDLDRSFQYLKDLKRINGSLRTQIGIDRPAASSARPEHEIDNASTTIDKNLENADYRHTDLGDILSSMERSVKTHSRNRAKYRYLCGLNREIESGKRMSVDEMRVHYLKVGNGWITFPLTTYMTDWDRDEEGKHLLGYPC